LPSKTFAVGKNLKVFQGGMIVSVVMALVRRAVGEVACSAVEVGMFEGMCVLKVFLWSIVGGEESAGAFLSTLRDGARWTKSE